MLVTFCKFIPTLGIKINTIKTIISIINIQLILALSTFLNAQIQMNWLKSFGDEAAQSGYQTLKLNDSSIILIGITQLIEID